jgi:hypothetical protein
MDWLWNGGRPRVRVTLEEIVEAGFLADSACSWGTLKTALVRLRDRLLESDIFLRFVTNGRTHTVHIPQFENFAGR